jgi:hypothetical protein
MNDDLHRWLDHELGEEDLPAELRDRARRWERLLGADDDAIGPAPSWLEDAVMRGIPARRPGRFAAILDWVTRPRTVRIRPATLGALAVAALAALLLWPGDTDVQPPTTGEAAPSPASLASVGDDGRVYVQFLYVAPDAGSVSVAGDFNEWSEDTFHLRDPDGDGVWTGRLPVSVGLHKYMFVVDGEWVTDPQAERYVDDGFGNRNALLSVTAGGGAI